MAASNQHPLQVLDQMFNEVLVQTGKHLKASLKEGPKNIAGASSAVRTKATDSLTSYHYALDDLESEITRAKAVVLRDLEKLRAARAPAPAPAPQPVAPPAPMMELPSSAAHTISAPAFAPKQGIKTAAPFPDMGMGMSSEMVDLTGSDKKPSPRVPPGAIRPPAKATPPVRNEVKPSPKQAPKPTPKPTPKSTLPIKVTPVPLPQIPRPQGFQPPQPPVMGPVAAAKPQTAAPNSQPVRQTQPAPVAQVAQNAIMMPANAAGSEPNATGGNGPNFTDMRFSLAPPSTEPEGAPTAPMPEFDLATFAPQGGNDIMSLGNSKPSNATNGQNTNAASQQQPKEQDKTDTNLDDLFNLDNGNGADGMFDLGGGGVNDSTFDDMMYFDNNDAEMAQFDEAYFLQ
ncbi:hypothetical protein F4781DRAFT_407227 [Annulohypoxylon bovei var. microspora]|nr:hypothetical protein F4781DRAFT_407227 [Annulohypoxylon bovei var. microspora]